MGRCICVRIRLHGYALDDWIGLCFEGKELKKMVSTGSVSRGFYLSIKEGEVLEKELIAEILSE